MSNAMLKFIHNLYQSGYYSYLIKIGLGLGQDAHVALVLFLICLLGLQSLEQTL